MTPQDIIRTLQLQPLPVEGGHFRETWRSPEVISGEALPVRYAGARALGSAIYYFLTDEPGCFSAMHRLSTDEIYHFYLGDPVEMLLLSPDGNPRRVLLGPSIMHGQSVQLVVPAGFWQGSRLADGGRFALLGTTMAPGFDAGDFVLASRDELLAQYPQAAKLIFALTR